MGGVSSTPAPPPRVAKFEQVSLVGILHPVHSTIRLMDMPPAITDTAREGIRLCAGLRRNYIFSTPGTESHSDSSDTAVAKTQELLSALVDTARKACNMRDYATLLVEDTILRLSMDLGPPREGVLELARFVNPFLASAEDGSGNGAKGPVEPFRATDAALITESEKDLLVLLYYCHRSNIVGSPDEAIGHMCKLAGKYGDMSQLDTRKEPLTETEVYLFWAVSFLATNISTDIPDSSLRPDSRSLLSAELARQFARLLTLCDMLVHDNRLDQVCFLLMFLRRLAAREDRTWWKSRAKRIAKELAKSRRGKQEWHAEFAQRTVRGMVKEPGKEGVEGWAGRNSLSFSREDLTLDGDLYNV